MFARGILGRISNRGIRVVNVDTNLALLLVGVGSILAVLFAFIWVAVRLGPKGRGHGGENGGNQDIFTDEYREHLRQRGVARFERTLDQNATFLQQDLHNIGEDVTEFVKERAGDILKEEFADQKQSVAAAQQRLAETFAKIENSIDDYQKAMTEQFNTEILAEKQRRLERFEKNMAQVVTGYVQQTLSEHMEVGEQIEFIICNLEANKQAIVEDIKREF